MCRAHTSGKLQISGSIESWAFLSSGSGAARRACPALCQDTLLWVSSSCLQGSAAAVHPPVWQKGVGSYTFHLVDSWELPNIMNLLLRLHVNLHWFVWSILIGCSCLHAKTNVQARFYLFCFIISLHSPVLILYFLLWLSWHKYLLKCFLFY